MALILVWRSSSISGKIVLPEQIEAFVKVFYFGRDSAARKWENRGVVCRAETCFRFFFCNTVGAMGT